MENIFVKIELSSNDVERLYAEYQEAKQALISELSREGLQITETAAGGNRRLDEGS